MKNAWWIMILVMWVSACSAQSDGLSGGAAHPCQLAPVTMDGPYPRCNETELLAVGFPDHKHSYWWPGWEVLKDENGVTYGPGSFCNRKTLIPRDGLLVEKGSNSFGHFATQQNSAYQPCDLLPMLETMVWAGDELSRLMGLEMNGTLTVISPDNVVQYRQMTGQDIWRLYRLKDDACIIEPYGTLQARTLDGHAVFMLVADWLLQKNLPVELPVWLHYGLVEYLGEDGAHLVNYMRQFRKKGDLVFSPPLTNFILGKGPDPDLETDREMFRRASYSAFLMVWELVENRGGMAAMRDFLGRVQKGEDLDQACQKVYKMNLEELAKSLDPVVLGEPIDVNSQYPSPSKPPIER